MGKSVTQVFKDVTGISALESIIPKAPKLDTSGQEALAEAQQKELELAEERKQKATNKAFAEAEAIKKGFRSKGQGLSVLGESEDQLLG